MSKTEKKRQTTKKISNSKESSNTDKKKSSDTNVKKTTAAKNTTVAKKSSTAARNENENDNDQYLELIDELQENFLFQKKLVADLEKILSGRKKELMLAKKIMGQNGEIKISNFNVPEPVPKSLKKLLKIDSDELTRSQVATLFYQYLKDHDMIDKRRKIIDLSNKIKKIFEMDDDDEMNFYNLQSWIRKLYNK